MEATDYIGPLVLTSVNYKRLTDELAAMSSKHTETVDRRLGQEGIALKAQTSAEQAAAAIPDMSAIQEALASADEQNRAADEAARQAQSRKDIDAAWATEKATREKYDADIQAIRDEKVKALADAKYPVDGMEFGEDDVLLNKLPFSQASQAEQIKAGIGVALAFNPKLRIIVTHDASLLDDDNLKLLHQLAQERKCYVIGERVSNKPGGGWFIEDGEVKQNATP